MQSLGTVDISMWSDYTFSDEQKKVFNEYMPTIDDVMDFYNIWKRLSIKAAAFYEAGVVPDEPIALSLAREWTEMTQKITGGKEEHQQAYLKVDNQREIWNPAERELIEKAEPFLDEILKLYSQQK